MDYLENQSRRAISILTVSLRKKGENWEMSEMKVEETVGEKLGLNVKDIAAEGARREREVWWKQAETERSKTPALQGQTDDTITTLIYIDEDSSDLILRKRKELMERSGSNILQHSQRQLLHPNNNTQSSNINSATFVFRREKWNKITPDGCKCVKYI